MTDFDVLILPGWNGSGESHWQTLWEQQNPHFKRVHQRNWAQPVRSHWVEALETHVQQASKPVILVGHSLGCITISHWARVRETRIAGALLVAPADVERRRAPHPLRNFAPIPRNSLPFPSVVVASSNDPTCSADKARELALSWGSQYVLLNGLGHINADSGLGNWAHGQKILQDLMQLSRLVQKSPHWDLTYDVEPLPHLNG